MIRIKNVVVDTLENETMRFTLVRDGFSIEIFYKPTIPNNVTKFCVFNDNE